MITFSIFSQIRQLTCFLTTRADGDLNIRRRRKSQQKFQKKFAFADSAIMMEQIHGNQVAVVSQENYRQLVKSVDGLVTNQQGVYLTVNTADCVPLFFCDPQKHIIGIAHAGWKGTISEIAKSVIIRMKKLGASTKDLRVAIGPHIGACCYDVEKKRAQLFVNRYHDETVAFTRENKWYIDIGKAQKLLLMEQGIALSHIDAPVFCTSCQNEQFFSFRKEKKETFGEMLGVIGYV